MVEHRVTDLLARLGTVHPDACCAGAAGAEVIAAKQRLHALLERLLHGSRVCVVHDSRLVLAAAGLDSGIALIAGTGSVAYGRASDGREAQRGGWGWMLGDEGAGVWITREAARLVISRADSDSPLAELGDSLLAAADVADVRELVRNLHARREPKEWAELASVVFETAGSDAGSREIIRRAGIELAKRAVEVRGALGIAGPVVLAGGLLLHQARLEEAVRVALPHVECIRLEQPPVEGAVRLAQALLER